MTNIVTRSAPLRNVAVLEQQGVHPLLARLYAARGIQTHSELDYELNPCCRRVTDPRRRGRAILLADAIEAEAKLLIVADYDCDGATACAVGIRALRAMRRRRSTIWCPTALTTATA